MVTARLPDGDVTSVGPIVACAVGAGHCFEYLVAPASGRHRLDRAQSPLEHPVRALPSDSKAQDAVCSLPARIDLIVRSRKVAEA